MIVGETRKVKENPVFKPQPSKWCTGSLLQLGERTLW